MPKLKNYVPHLINRFKRGLRNLSKKRMACFLEPNAKRGSVRGVYLDLRWTFRAQPSPFEKAEIAFIQKDEFQEWYEQRENSGLPVALSQMPHVSALLTNKAALARLVSAQPYALETYIDSAEGQFQGIWVQKPSVGGRGRDIEFLRNPSDWDQPGYVLQRYIENPYLIDKRKFDVRVFVKIDDTGELLIHKEGLLRCATLPFEDESLDPLIHNSNVCFQGRQGVKKETHTLLSDLAFAESAMKQVATILEDVFRLLNEQGVFKGSGDFEILGVDFLIDANEKVWLLEINQHPGWHSSHQLSGGFYLDALESLFP